MKYRVSFVTNSSDSCFIISKAKLTGTQLSLIRDHITVAKELAGKVDFDFGSFDKWDEWRITETDDTIEAYTSMNNFDMDNFLSCIGVDPNIIKWD